jgi:hypothetical protein
MKLLLVVIVVLLCSVSTSHAGDDQGENCIGDYGCMHELLHESYQAFFGTECCHQGECRPTKVQWARDRSGMMAWVDRMWVHIPPDAYRSGDRLPPLLNKYAAHVCASKEKFSPYGSGAPPAPTIYCAALKAQT